MKKPTILKKVATALVMTAICCSTLVPTMAKAELQPRGCGTNNHDWHEQNVKTEYVTKSTHPYIVTVTDSNGNSWDETKTCSIADKKRVYDRICYNCWKLEVGLWYIMDENVHLNCGR